MMKIAVVGASGFTGKPLVELALKEGHEVYAISRNGKFEDHKNLSVLNEDINEWEKLVEPLKDIDVIISNFNAGWSNPNLYEDYLKGSHAVLELSKALDVRVIIVGGASSLFDPKTNQQMYDFMPEDFKKIVKGALDLYTELKQDFSSKWVFISPAMDLNDQAPKGDYHIGGDYVIANSEGKSQISIYDLADFLLKVASNKLLIHTRLTLSDK